MRALHCASLTQFSLIPLTRTLLGEIWKTAVPTQLFQTVASYSASEIYVSNGQSCITLLVLRTSSTIKHTRNITATSPREPAPLPLKIIVAGDTSILLSYCRLCVAGKVP
jgi:hypothetical protein